MAVPLLATLSRAARTAWPIIQRGVREGLSSNIIGQRLTAGGMGIRRQTLLSLASAERKIWTHGQALKFLNLGQKPNLLKIPQALSKIRREFSYLVELRGPTFLTDPLDRQRVTVVTDRLLTRGEAEAAAEELGVAGKDRYARDIASVQLIQVLRAGELGKWT